MSLDWIVRGPFGVTLAAIALLLVAGLEVIPITGRRTPVWLRPATAMVVVVLAAVIVARFARFV